MLRRLTDSPQTSFSESIAGPKWKGASVVYPSNDEDRISLYICCTHIRKNERYMTWWKAPQGGPYHESETALKKRETRQSTRKDHE